MTFRMSSKILSKLWQWLSPCALIQDLVWTQLESTLRIMTMSVENSSFGYGLTIGDLVKGVFTIVARRPSDYQTMSPGGEYFAPLWRMFRICGRFQNLGWTKLEYTLKFMRERIKNDTI